MAAPRLRLAYLGPPQVELDGRLLPKNSLKATALLAYLAIEDRPHPRSALATMLWPDAGQANALANLRRSLRELGRALGEGWIVEEHDHIRLAVRGDIRLDTAEFRAAVARCNEPETSPECLDALTAAVALYRDDLLAGLSLIECPEFDDWQIVLTDEFRTALGQALAQLAVAHEIRAEWEQGVAQAQRWLQLDPLHEPAHRQLMRLYAGSGQRAAALRQYEQCRQLLAAELWAEPSPETTALYHQIRTGQALAEAGRAFERPLSGDTPDQVRPRLNLPVPATPFVGRQREVKEVAQLILSPEVRLLTLIGPGGSGKTRLSLRAAREAAERDAAAFPDGVYFVALAPLSSADSIVTAIAGALDFCFYNTDAPPRQQLLDYLREKKALLIMDNYEHLLNDRGATIAGELLSQTTGVSILATSRIRLQIQGETLYIVRGMSIPTDKALLPQIDVAAELAGHSSLQLFRQSARRVSPAFELTAENLPDVVRICRIVQGMPLGIELAAAWVEVLSPAEIGDEIERSLDFLATELQDVPDRQRSARAVFNTSWQLLSAAEQRALADLSIFSGGFTRSAAEAVSLASLRLILGLVNKSWLQQVGDGRFITHELLRQYAEEQLRADLIAWQETRTRHAEYYRAFLADMWPRFRGNEQAAACDAISSELENARRCWNWHVEQSAFHSLVNELLPPIAMFSYIRSMSETTRPWLESALERLAGADDYEDKRLHLTALLTALASLLFDIRDFSRAAHLVLQAWEQFDELSSDKVERLGVWASRLLNMYAWQGYWNEGIDRLRDLLLRPTFQTDDYLRAFAAFDLGNLLAAVKERYEARQYLQEALALFESLGEHFGRGNALNQLAAIARSEQNYAEALPLLESAETIFRALKNWAGVGGMLHARAELLLQEGHPERIFPLFREQQRIFREIGNRNLLYDSLHWEGIHALRYSDIAHALQMREECLLVSREFSHDFATAWDNWEMGEILRVGGESAKAREWYERAEALFAKNQFPRGRSFYHRAMGDLALAEGAYETARDHFRQALEITLNLHWVWAEAYMLYGLGRAATGLGRLNEAQAYLLQSLRLAHEEGHRDLCTLPLAGLAELAAAARQRERVVELCAFLVYYPITWNEIKRLAGNLMAEASAELPPTVAAAAEERGRDYELAPLVAEMLAAQVSS